MRLHTFAMGLALVTALSGCGRSQAEDGEKPELPADLKSLVLDETPSDLPNPVYIDFGGKVELIGFELSPDKLAAPGSKVTLKSFWRSVGRLGEGYQLFTELVTPSGKRFAVDANGPLRKGSLGPGSWEPGKVYVDQVELSVPEALEAPRFSIVTGIKTAPVPPEEAAEAGADKDAKDDKKAEKPAQGTFGEVFLPVLSGVADSKHGGIIASLETGVTPGAKRARAAKDQRGPNDKRQALPLNKLPSSAKPRPNPLQPAANPQPAQ